MKIRTGFISNSSSACYIVRIKENPVDFLCNREIFDIFNFRSELEQEIKDYKRYLRNSKKGLKQAQEGETVLNEEYWENTIKRETENIERLKQLLKTVEDMGYRLSNADQLKLAEMILNEERIRHLEYKDNIILGGYTTMHNSYSEGVNELLKEIILLYTFEKPKLIETLVEHQDGQHTVEDLIEIKREEIENER